jgi:hypothetical protein
VDKVVQGSGASTKTGVGRCSSASGISARLLAGLVGVSASHVIDEYSFETLADFEAALAGMAAPQFKPHSDVLAPFIVPGSQHWVVYRVLEQP